MARGEYNDYISGFSPGVPDGDSSEAGYLVEYYDTEHRNHPGHAGYISWSPAKVFEVAYRPSETLLDRLLLERDALIIRRNDLELSQVDVPAGCEHIESQLHAMGEYLGCLNARIYALLETSPPQ